MYMDRISTWWIFSIWSFCYRIKDYLLSLVCNELLLITPAFSGKHWHMHLSRSDILFPYAITNDCVAVALSYWHVPLRLHRGRSITLKTYTLYFCVGNTNCCSSLVIVVYEFPTSTTYYLWVNIFLFRNRAPCEKSYSTETGRVITKS